MMNEEDYHLDDPTWCRGCGLFAVFASLKKASADLNLAPEEIVVVTGIGCHGRLNNYFHAYGFHGLHGRALPVAAGVKLANTDLSVVVISGDGDAYSIGLGHFIHSVRRNVNLAHIVVDNRIYGLTQGQTSPTSRKGFVSISTPTGSKEMPLEGPLLALVSGGKFVARGFSGDPKQLTSLLKSAMTHNGYSLVEVLSPCVTHNKVDTYKWYQSHIRDLDSESDYDPKDRSRAMALFNDREKLPVGLLFKEEGPSFDDLSLPGRNPIVFTDLKVETERLNKLLEKFE
jgi:2-oxoglutarate ferredoxin oxidoreductase subunit beta